jgi:hypothetical protein
MIGARTFNVRWIVPGAKDIDDFDRAADTSTEYSGAAVAMKHGT